MLVSQARRRSCSLAVIVEACAVQKCLLTCEVDICPNQDIVLEQKKHTTETSVINNFEGMISVDDLHF